MNHLEQSHINHLISEGFSTEIIEQVAESGLIQSLSPEEAAKEWHRVKNDKGEPVTGGLLFKFSETFSQLRVDHPELIAKTGEKLPKYLSPAFPIDETCSFIPAGCEVITEGMKDALAFSYIGDIPTGAIAGVSHAVKALPAGCGYTIIFDADGWDNEKIFLSLIKAGVHCEGRINILPDIPNEPKAGGCEYFKAGYSSADYRKLIDEALTPIELFESWLQRQNITSPAGAAKVAVMAGKVYGAINGYATSAAKSEIKNILQTPLLSQYGLEFHAVCADSGNTKESKKAADKAENGGDIDALEVALSLIRTNCTLFHSPEPDSIEYVEIPTPHHAKKTVPIQGTDFKKWLRGAFYGLVGFGIGSEDMSMIIETAKAIAAFDGPELPVSLQRVAQHGDRYFIYLADEQHNIIEIGANGWNHCPNCPVKFVSDKYKSPMPSPCRGGSIDDLWEFVRLSNPADRLAALAFMVKAWVPGGTDPIFVLSGYQDSGKTTAAQYIRMMVDPFDKGQTLAKIPYESDAIAIHSQQRRVLSFDNLSSLTKDQSDFLCGVATGTGISKRKLFSDGEEVILDIKNLVMMTTIGQIVKEPDLLSRSVVLELPRLAPTDRAEDEAILAAFNIAAPHLFGSLLDIACKAIAYRDANKSTFKQYTRFGAYSLLGEGVEHHLKYPKGTLKNRIQDAVKIAHEVTIEASGVGSAISSWINSDAFIWRNADGKEFKHQWEGTSTQLLSILKVHAKKSELASGIPKTANALSGELTKIESALMNQNIEIVRFTHKKIKYISIKLLEQVDDISPTPIHLLVAEKESSKRSIPSIPLENEGLEQSPTNGFNGIDPRNKDRFRIDSIETSCTPKNSQNPFLVSGIDGIDHSDDTKNQEIAKSNPEMYIDSGSIPCPNSCSETVSSDKNENRSSVGIDPESILNKEIDSTQNLLPELVRGSLEKHGIDGTDLFEDSFFPTSVSVGSNENISKPQDPNDPATYDKLDEV